MPDHPDTPANGKGSGREMRGRTPRGVSPIVPGRSGRPSYSLDALRELVERQFSEETAGRTDILLDLDSEAKRRTLLDEIVSYVIATEAVTLSSADHHRLIDSAYASLFSFGPLDDLLRDDTVTEITINGPHDIHARRGMRARQKTAFVFDDVYHLETILQRVLAGAGLTLSGPFLDAGIEVYARRARLSIIGPPVRTGYSIDIRLHPAHTVTFTELRDRFAVLDNRAIMLLNAILSAGHSLLIVGDAGLGKTTLAGAVIAALNESGTPPKIAAVERCAELHLPPGVTRLTPAPDSTFAESLSAALAGRPDWLIADEIRREDAAALWDALTREHAPHYVWVFRGARQSERLKSALSMVIRQFLPALAQADINDALVKRLPFVAALGRAGDSPRLAMIAEWARDEADPAALSLRPLLEHHVDEWALTGARSAHALDLPESFWDEMSQGH